MADPDPPPAALFAALTAVFEDAAGLAAEGQAADLTATDVRRIGRRLRRLVSRADEMLGRLGA